MIPQPARAISSELIRLSSPKVSSLSFSPLRPLCLPSALCVAFFLFSLFSDSSPAQNLDKPLLTIDEEITAFAYAPDGRIVYSVYRKVKSKEYEALEHDDIWLQDLNGKRRRLLEGQKYTRGNQTFSYLIDSFRWSPNGHFILAELLTTTVLDDAGKTEDSFQTLVLDDSGHEIRINKGDSVIPDAAASFFLPDNATIAFLSEAVKPRQLFSLKSTRIDSGPLKSPNDGRTFRDVSPVPGTVSIVAVEQDRAMNGPNRLQRLDLFTDNDKELATLEGYEGGLSVSPSGKKAAYFIDKEVLEVRDLTSPNRVARLRIGLGVFRWSPDESRILLKRAIEKKSGDLVWIDLPPLAPIPANREILIQQPTPIPVLHGLSFRDFAVSLDGRSLAVIIPGKRNLLVFSLSR
jgi:dipeptidyl aminopeptidase/acylaminoacyl peptidase